MPHNTQITIYNELDWELEDEMYLKCLQVAQRHAHWATHIDVYPQQRVPEDAPEWRSPGWLEWLVVMQERDMMGSVLRALTVGVLQRKKGEEYECHS